MPNVAHPFHTAPARRPAGPKGGTRNRAAEAFKVVAQSRELLARLRAILDQSAQAEDAVVALSERLLARQPPPAVLVSQAALRQKAITDFLARYPPLTSVEVDALGGRVPTPSNRSARASRWRKEGRIFAVRARGRDGFPSFQFEHGEPREVIRALLPIVGRSGDGWAEALWFASPHAYLGGRAPADELIEGGAGAEERLLEAARWQVAAD